VVSLRRIVEWEEAGAQQVERRVLRADRDGVLVDWGARLGTLRHPWAEIGARFVRLPRRGGGGQ
jgi:hypothetical protein